MSNCDVLTRKQRALGIAAQTEREWCRELLPGESYTPPVSGILFVGKRPYPEDHYNPHRYFSDSEGNFRTAFGKKAGVKKKIANLILSLEKEVSGEDSELYLIEYPQALEVLEDFKLAQFRGKWERRMFYARQLLRSPDFIGPGINTGRVPGLPAVGKGLNSIRRTLDYASFGNNSAGSGAPWFRKWNTEDGKSPISNDRFHLICRRLAYSLASELTFAGPREIAKMVERYSGVFYNVLLTRSQGRGRVVVNVPRVLNMIAYWCLNEVFRLYMRSTTFFIGGMETRLNKAQFFSRCKPGSWMNEADDITWIAVVDGRPCFVSGDCSGFDHGIHPLSFVEFFRQLAGKISSRRLMIYRNLILLQHLLPARCPQGFMFHAPLYGLDSGGYDTKLFGTWEQARRINLLRRFWINDLYEEGMSLLNLMGEFRAEKQILCRDTFTVCQLVYSRHRPTVLHGILPRVLRNLVELEQFSQEPMPADFQFVQALMPLYGHPKFRDVCIALKDDWNVRVPSSVLLATIRSRYNYENRAAGGGAPVDSYEKTAICEVVKFLGKG